MTKESEHIHQNQEITEVIFESLFRSHYVALCQHAFNFVKDNQTADDIVQEFFIQLWNKRNKLIIKGSLEAYSRQAVRNSCLNFLKHDSFVKRVFTQYREIQEINIHPEEENPTDEIQQKVRSALNKLPKKCRKVFLLGNASGLKYAEIAQTLNVSINTVKTQMGIAYKIMRNELGPFLSILFFFLR